jgi:hypothetical protein
MTTAIQRHFQGPLVEMTEWENPTQATVTFVLRAGGTPLIDERWPKLPNGRHAPLPQPPVWHVVVPPKGIVTSEEDQQAGLARGYVFGSDGRVELPSDHDNSVVRTVCVDERCGKKLLCKDRTHATQIVGGGAPQLRRVRRDGDTHVEPELSPLMLERRPTLSPEDVDERLLARVRGGT